MALPRKLIELDEEALGWALACTKDEQFRHQASCKMPECSWCTKFRKSISYLMGLIAIARHANIKARKAKHPRAKARG